MLTASFDPSVTQILVAVIGGGGLALAATIQGFFSYKASREAQNIVARHVEDEATSVSAITATLERQSGALDMILEWQGKHEATHTQTEARVRAEAAAVKSRLEATERIAEASQALVRDLHDRPHASATAVDQ